MGCSAAGPARSAVEDPQAVFRLLRPSRQYHERQHDDAAEVVRVRERSDGKVGVDLLHIVHAHKPPADSCIVLGAQKPAVRRRHKCPSSPGDLAADADTAVVAVTEVYILSEVM